MGKVKEGLATFDRVVELQTKLSFQDRFRFISPELATTHLSRGQVQLAEGNIDLAFKDFEHAIGFLEPLTKQQNRPDLVLDLARALRFRGEAFFRQKRLSEARSDVLRACNLVSPLLDENCSLDVRFQIANTLSIYGFLLTRISERTKKRSNDLLHEADRVLSLAIPLFRKLTGVSGKRSYRYELASALTRRSIAKYRLGDRLNARKDIEESCRQWKNLIEEDSQVAFRIQFANCAINLGVVDADDGKIGKGLEMIDSGIQLFQDIANSGDKAVIAELAAALQIRGRIRGNNNQAAKAVRDLDESIKLFKILIERDGRTEFQSSLDRSKRHREEAASGKKLLDLP